jgi:hypothetical protein
MPTIHVSEVVREELRAYKEANQHTSYDSAVRELLREVNGE